MKSLKLSILFESVINGRVDLTPYPDLKKLVNLYTPVKIGGNYIIRPDDFDSLLNANDVNTKDFFQYINTGNYNEDVLTDNPQMRVYNFMKELRKKIESGNPEYKKAFDELNILISDIAKNKTNNTDTFKQSTSNVKPDLKTNQTNPEQEPQIENTLKSLDNTEDLKNLVGITVDNKNYAITDQMLSVFITKADDPNVIKYKDAMYNDNISLPDDSSSPEGLVYTLFKKLKTNCTQLLRSQVAINDKIKNSSSFNKISSSVENFNAVDRLDLATLPQNTEVKIRYSLRNKNGTYYGSQGKLVEYEGIFSYNNLTWHHRFINKIDKNNYFLFYKKAITSNIEVGGKYEVQYNTIDINKADLFMEIKSLKIKHKEKADLSAMKPCTAMDELIDILNLD